MAILINFMEYIDGYLENIMFTIIFIARCAPLFVFMGGYYVNRTQYQRNNIILKNIEKVKLDIDNVKSRDNKDLRHELKKLRDNYEEEYGRLIDKIKELSLEVIDKDKKITEFDQTMNKMKLKIRDIEKISEKEDEKKIEDSGIGVFRYKNKEGTIYYHGMGHLEHKYSWWKPYMNRMICVYTNENRKIKFPDFETHNINDFCSNCEYCGEINKNKRNMFYYECKGHKINID